MRHNPMARHLADKRNRQRILPDKRQIERERNLKSMQLEMDKIPNGLGAALSRGSGSAKQITVET